MTLPHHPTRVVVIAPRPLDRDLLALALDGVEGIDVVAAAPTLVGDPTVTAGTIDAVLVRITRPGPDVLAEVAVATRHRDRPRVVVLAGFVDAYVVDRLHAVGAHAVASPDQPLPEILGLLLGGDESALPRLDRHALGHRHRLTTRELEVLDHLADGVPPGQIAHLLQLRVTTVRDHIKSLRAKLDCSSATQLVVTAHRLGLAPHVSRPLL